MSSTRSSGCAPRVHPERVTWLERVPVERFFELNVAPMEGPQFEPTMILTLHDLSEARRVERMRVDFVANASHELRTPLASLLGFIETLQGPAREDAEARVKFLAIMREQAQRMTRLVDDLLSLSRIEQNLHLRPQAPVDIVSILRHIADTLAPMARDNDVVLKVDVPAKVIVTGDRDELLRVVENLVENAIKYGACDPRSASRQVEITLVAAAAPMRPERPRPRSWDRARTSAAVDRTILPGRCRPEPGQGRHRPWPRHRQTYRRAPSRPARHRIEAGRGVDLQRDSALAGRLMRKCRPVIKMSNRFHTGFTRAD